MSAVAVGVLCLFASPVAAGVDEGVAAYKSLDFETALAELEPAAYSGNATAAYYLGMMYERGEGVRRNASTAWVLYQSAAAKHPDAEYRIGLMFQSGRGVPLKPKDALKWHLKAAKRDHRRAMVAAGMIYLEGRGVNPDLIKGQQWLEKAAALGDPDARATLDRLADEGRIARLPLAGNPNPMDPDLRKVLADVNTMLKPYLNGSLGTRVTLESPLRIKRENGRFAVYLPNMKVQRPGDDGVVLLGTMRLGLTPVGEDRYQMDILVPSVMTVTDAGGQPMTTITLGEQKASMLWSMPLGAALQADIRYGDLKVRDTDGAAEMDIASLRGSLVTKEPSPDRLDGKEKLVIEGLRVRSGPVPGETMSLSSLSLEGGFTALDVKAYLRYLARVGVDWQAGRVPPDVVNKMLSGPEALPILFSGASFSTSLKGLSVGGVTVQSGDFGVTVNELDTDSAWVHLSMGLKHVQAPQMKTVSRIDPPLEVSAAVTVSGIPAKALFARMTTLMRDTLANNPGLAGGAGAVPLPMEAFDFPDVTVRIDEVLVVGEAYDVKVTGAFKTPPASKAAPSAQSIAPYFRADGTLIVAVRGLDGVLKDNPDKRLLDIADRSEDADGRTIHSFRVKFTPEGEILVNGTNADELMAAPTPEGQRP